MKNLGTPLNVSGGGTGASSISGALDAAFGSTQGSVLYRGASGWAALGPGTSGQVLQTAGSGANPSWANMAVTSTGVTTSGSPAAGQFAMFTSASAIGTATAGPNAVLAGPASGTASGTVTARALVPADDPAPADGCCRLSVASTTSLLLSPYNGNTLWVGGQACTIPSGGVTLSGQTSLSAGTLYYVYATASGGAVNALVLSTTGHIAGSDGRQYLSSGGQNPTPVYTSRLVGMVYTSTAAAPFLDSATWRGCASWFNRRNRQVSSGDPGLNTGQTSWIEYTQTRCTFLTWGDEDGTLHIGGTTNNTVANAENFIGFWLGGSGGQQSGYFSQGVQPAANSSGSTSSASVNSSTSTPYSFAEGVQQISIACFTNAGTMTMHVGLGFTTRI